MLTAPAQIQRVPTGSGIFGWKQSARAHRELNTLRRSHISGQALVAQLLRIIRDYNLEEAYRAIEDRAEEMPLIPRIVCSEVLL